ENSQLLRPFLEVHRPALERMIGISRMAVNFIRSGGKISENAPPIFRIALIAEPGVAHRHQFLRHAHARCPGLVHLAATIHVSEPDVRPAHEGLDSRTSCLGRITATQLCVVETLYD